MDNTNYYSTTSNYALNGKIMLCSVTILLIIVCIVVCFHTYPRWCSTRSHHRQQRRGHRRLHQPPNTPPTATNNNNINTTMDFSRQNGLDGSILKTIPIFVYSPTTAAVLECAVCLSEFEDSERGRTLPQCGHAFHVACIDKWFWSHTNCPLCRAPVNQQPDNAINAPDHHPAPETGSSDVVVITVTDESSATVSEQTRDAGYSGTLPVGGFQPEWCPRKAEGLVGLAAVEVGSVENSGSGSPERNGYNKSVSL